MNLQGNLFETKLKELRKSKGWTQGDLAKRIGIVRTAISNYETGRAMPDSNTLNILANLFDVSVDYLLGRENNNMTKSFTSVQNTKNDADRSKILDAVKKDDELLEFTKELSERESMKLLFKQVKPLSDDEIARVMRIIKAIEDEEDKQDGV